MSEIIKFQRDQATAAEITGHLLLCDASFTPPLSQRVDIASYALKISANAVRFEAWADESLIGLVAAYCNDKIRRAAHITNVSIMPEWRGKGIASQLLHAAIEHARRSRFKLIELEVDPSNASAINLYEKSGFVSCVDDQDTLIMTLNL